MIPKEDREGPVITIKGLGVECSGNTYAEAVSDFLFEKNLALHHLAKMIEFDGDLENRDLQDFVFHLAKDPRFEVSVEQQ